MEELKAKMEELKLEHKEIMREIRNLETRATISEKDISVITKQLEKISTNTTWILRIIIGIIVAGLLNLLIQTGI
jgi:septal ring factor EnvC (AmiA/AmiB activator)